YYCARGTFWDSHSLDVWGQGVL
nr:anti-SIV gp148 Ig heavy chain {CDR3 heavy chain region} [Macaca fascicularis=cynomolgus monkey, Peptide Partial, 22 aa] [Macaca fascicularis]